MAQEQQPQAQPTPPTVEQIFNQGQQSGGVPPTQQPYNQFGNPYSNFIPNAGDDIGAMQQKMTNILRCDIMAMGRLMELIGRRGQIAYSALNGLHTMSPADRGNVRAEISRIDVQIAQMLAL